MEALNSKIDNSLPLTRSSAIALIKRIITKDHSAADPCALSPLFVPRASSASTSLRLATEASALSPHSDTVRGLFTSVNKVAAASGVFRGFKGESSSYLLPGRKTCVPSPERESWQSQEGLAEVVVT